MYNYYVNKNEQPGREHEVHKQGCSWMPEIKNLWYLGEFPNGIYAVAKARKYYANVDGCCYCCREVHKR